MSRPACAPSRSPSKRSDLSDRAIGNGLSEIVMDRRWTSFLGFALTILITSATPALTEDRKAFKVIYLYEISNKGEKARIRTRATKSRVAAIQAEINGDPALVSRL